jgi:hypothetical protein
MKQSFIFKILPLFFVFVFCLVILWFGAMVFIAAKYGAPALDAGVQILENVAETTKPK